MAYKICPKCKGMFLTTKGQGNVTLFIIIKTQENFGT